MKKLLSRINEQLKRPQRRQDLQLYEDRANVHCANGDWKDAGDDFEKVLDLAPNDILKRRIRGDLIRCEAHRSRWDRMLKWLRESEWTVAEVEALAQRDEAVREGLTRPGIRAWMQTQQRESGGR
jgi:protein involved in temperature-dependent protein secretion